MLKGILTITMILCHSIQFFGVEDDPVQGFLVNVINLTTFSGFVFCFGYVGEMAYFQKGWMEGACKMGKNMLRILIAFYLSGIAYVALVEGKIFRMDFIREALFLPKEISGVVGISRIFLGNVVDRHPLFSGFKKDER